MSQFYDSASLVLVPSGYRSGKIYSQKPLSTDGELSFSRASTATRVNASGLIESVASGVPRLDYSGGASCPSLLLEPQATALNQFSEQFDNAYWFINAANVVANNAISPDGYQNADLLYPTSAGVSRYVLKFVGATSGLAYTTSVFAKASGKNWLGMANVDSGSTTAWFNLSTGTVGTVLSGTTAKMESYGNGWYRCSVTRTTAATLGAIVLLVEDNDNSDSVTPNGTDGILLWGCNLTQTSYVQSYIPTLSSAVTRVQDSCNKTSASALIGATAGTMFIEVENNPSAYLFTAPNNVIFASINSGNYLNNFHFTTDSGSVYVYCNANSGVLQAVLGTTLPTTPTLKMAVTYTTSAIKFFLNGALVATDTSFTLPSGMSRIDVGHMSAQPDSQRMRGNTKQFLLFTSALSDADAITLTTL